MVKTWDYYVVCSGSPEEPQGVVTFTRRRADAVREAGAARPSGYVRRDRVTTREARKYLENPYFWRRDFLSAMQGIVDASDRLLREEK